MKEIWKHIDLDLYRNNYMVSNLGNVKSIKRNKVMKSWNHRLGYKVIQLSNKGKSKNFYVHRLVGITFISNLNNKPCICHKDDNPSNNHIDNLFWGTHSDNMMDKVRKTRQGDTGKNKRKQVLFLNTGQIFDSRVTTAKELDIHPKYITEIIYGRMVHEYKFEYIKIDS